MRAENRKSKRIDYIDIAKLIGIAGVVFDHSQYHIQPVPSSFFVIRIWVFTFFLQIFFFTSGMTNSNRPMLTAKKWRRFLAKSVRSILVPYFLWCFFLGYGFNLSFLKNILWGTQSALAQTTTDSVLWFLPAMFTARLYYQIIIDLLGKFEPKRAWLFLTSAMIAVFALGFCLCAWSENRIPFGADIGLIGCGLMLMGSLFTSVVRQLEKYAFSLQVVGIFLICLAGSIAFGLLNMPFKVDESGSVIYEKAVWMAHGQFGKNGILFVASSLAGCTMILIVSMWLRKIRILSVYGRHTLGIMAIHNKVYPLVAWLLAGMTTYFHFRESIFVLALAALLAMVCTAPWVALTAKFAPMLEGKWSEQTEVSTACQEKG